MACNGAVNSLSMGEGVGKSPDGGGKGTKHDHVDIISPDDWHVCFQCTPPCVLNVNPGHRVCTYKLQLQFPQKCDQGAQANYT